MGQSEGWTSIRTIGLVLGGGAGVDVWAREGSTGAESGSSTVADQTCDHWLTSDWSGLWRRGEKWPEAAVGDPPLVKRLDAKRGRVRA